MSEYIGHITEETWPDPVEARGRLRLNKQRLHGE